MAIFGRKNIVDKLRADIGALETRRTALAEQRAIASTVLEKAKGAARDALIAGDGDFEDGAVATAERKLSTVDDALVEIARRIEDACAELAEAEDTAAREAEAKSREATASKIDALAVRMERSIDELVGILSELVANTPATVEPHRYDQLMGDVGKLNEQEIVNVCFAEAMYAACPKLFDIKIDHIGGLHFDAAIRLRYRRADGFLAENCPQQGPHNFRPASGVVDALIGAPLRASAALIRSGELPANAPALPQPSINETAEAAG